jgi:hypothetical protein
MGGIKYNTKNKNDVLWVHAFTDCFQIEELLAMIHGDCLFYRPSMSFGHDNL